MKHTPLSKIARIRRISSPPGHFDRVTRTIRATLPTTRKATQPCAAPPGALECARVHCRKYMAEATTGMGWVYIGTLSDIASSKMGRSISKNTIAFAIREKWPKVRTKHVTEKVAFWGKTVTRVHYYAPDFHETT